MVSNCDCVNNGTFVDASDYVRQYAPRQDAGSYPPAVYDNMSYTGSVFDNSTFANTYSGMNGLHSRYAVNSEPLLFFPDMPLIP